MPEYKYDRKEAMRKICEEVIALKDLFRKPYSDPLSLPIVRVQTHMKPVIGEGSHFARVVFIGEAPGKNEAETGRPFCGAAGRILDELLASAGIERKSVYITNIVKDRPPFNRDPLPEEIRIYSTFLDRQIDIIQPKAIATLGRFSMDYIMRKFGLDTSITNISDMRGKIFDAQATYGPIKIIPLYHPAVAVYDSSRKQELVDDFKALEKFK